MRVVVTGGAGFIGRAIVARLADRGDDVVALVRDAARATHLEREHVSLVVSDLSSVPQLTAQMNGADAVVHAAGQYRIGVTESDCQRMRDANVGTTERVLDAAIQSNVSRIVYVSTVGIFGNTNGELVDETFRRDLTDGWLGCYDETKYFAHQAAEQRIAEGAPIVIVQPSQVYGPNDHSLTSAQISEAHGGRLRFAALTNSGACWVHVDDLASGIVNALDRGRIGESYVLAGQCVRLNAAIATAARVGGRKPPRFTFPTRFVRLLAPINDRFGGFPGMPENLAETIRSGDNVTYWARSDKAISELDFAPRPLEQGIADTWGRGTADQSRHDR